MKCHICDQPAVGQCQVCWKFYCAAHGDIVCQPCQERRSARQGGRGGSSFVMRGHDEPSGATRPRPPPNLDQSTPKRVIGVADTAKGGETEVTLLSLELHEEGFVANFILKGWGPGPNPYAALPVPGFHRTPTFYAEAADDQGNVYEVWPRSGGGGGGHWRQALHFAPGLATSASHLHVSIDEIQWMAIGGGVRSVIELGPWQFDISLE